MRFIYNKHKQTNHRNTPFLNYRIFYLIHSQKVLYKH